MDKKAESQSRTRRWVVKIGSALLTNNGQGLDHQAIAGWVEQIAKLQDDGLEVVLVSSGAVAEGVSRLGWQQRPTLIHELQAAKCRASKSSIQEKEML